jgi:hypothetical protein
MVHGAVALAWIAASASGYGSALSVTGTVWPLTFSRGSRHGSQRTRNQYHGLPKSNHTRLAHRRRGSAPQKYESHVGQLRGLLGYETAAAIRRTEPWYRYLDRA